MPTPIRFLALSACLLAGSAQAQVAVYNAWVRATVPAQPATGAFMRLQAPAQSKLVGASSPAAGTVEVHEMAIQDDVMRMRQIPFIALPANVPVELKPGGYHLMLLDLKRQAREGDSIALSLIFETADGRRTTVQTNAAVRGLAGKP